jgi:hypothetical protein
MLGPKPDNHKTVKGSKTPTSEELIPPPLNRNFLTTPFQIKVERMELTSINVETNARKSACQIKAKKFCFAMRS